MVQAAGPIRSRTKYKDHKLLRAEASVVLPFAPFAGLYLSFSKPKKRGEPLTLYLRIRVVEWNLTEKRFECVADEMLGSAQFSETYEVRGGARIKKHFVALQNTLIEFGFDVDTGADGELALHRSADGTELGKMSP
jgi:hypothetical protein